MTAFNVIARPDAAYLITDTACYANGVVTHFQPKVLELGHAVTEPAAIAFTGQVFPQDLLPALIGANLLSATQLLAALPDLISEGERAWQRNRQSRAVPEFTLGVATFNRLTSTAGAFVCGNDPALFGANDYEPYSVREILFHAVVDVEAAFGKRIDLASKSDFDPIEDAERLLNQQRRELEGGVSIVGGQGVVTVVDASGVSSKIICEWPDKVGHPISDPLEA